MGTDMGAFIERRENDKWVPAEEPDSFIYDDPDPYLDDLGYDWKKKELIADPKPFMIDRNSAFYAALGDGPCGFYEITESLAANRGLPDDMSASIADHVRREEQIADHRYGWSWVTLQELLNAGWDKKFTQENGYVKKQFAHLFSDPSQPFPTQEFPAGEDWLSTEPWGKEHEYERVYWTITYEEAIGEEFLVDLILRLREYGEPEDVRMVFYFF